MKCLLLLLLLPLSVFSQDCGLKGTIADRIIDCSIELKESGLSEKEDNLWSLVVKSGQNEVRVDEQSHQIWRFAESPELNYYDAEELCKKFNKDHLGLKNMHWRLPSSSQLIASQDKLVFMKNKIWTKDSPEGSYGRKSSDGVFIDLRSSDGPKSVNKFKTKSSVVCVSEKEY